MTVKDLITDLLELPMDAELGYIDIHASDWPDGIDWEKAKQGGDVGLLYPDKAKSPTCDHPVIALMSVLQMESENQWRMGR